MDGSAFQPASFEELVKAIGNAIFQGSTRFTGAVHALLSTKHPSFASESSPPKGIYFQLNLFFESVPIDGSLLHQFVDEGDEFNP